MKKTYLKYLEEAGKIKYKKCTVVLFKCQCVCGEIVIVRKQHFINGHTVSCGCYQREKIKQRSLTHGMSNTRTYRIWASMLSRCLNENVPQYKNYGGREIKVCDEWANSFETFYSDMGKCPSKLHSIDRINNDGNYCIDNCKWSTRIEQCSNKTNNSKYLYKGDLLTTTEISRRSGIVRSRISNWKNRSGYSKEKIESLIIKYEKTK